MKGPGDGAVFEGKDREAQRARELEKEAERERERQREKEIRAFREFSTKLPLKQQRRPIGQTLSEQEALGTAEQLTALHGNGANFKVNQSVSKADKGGYAGMGFPFPLEQVPAGQTVGQRKTPRSVAVPPLEVGGGGTARIRGRPPGQSGAMQGPGPAMGAALAPHMGNGIIVNQDHSLGSGFTAQRALPGPLGSVQPWDRGLQAQQQVPYPQGMYSQGYNAQELGPSPRNHPMAGMGPGVAPISGIMPLGMQQQQQQMPSQIMNRGGYIPGKTHIAFRPYFLQFFIFFN